MVSPLITTGGLIATGGTAALLIEASAISKVAILVIIIVVPT